MTSEVTSKTRRQRWGGEIKQLLYCTVS